MLKSFMVMLCFFALGCSSQIHKVDNQDSRYFSDATDCFHSSEQKQKLNIPITAQNFPISATVIEIPLATDAGAFRLCMEHKGHPASSAKANAEDYLNVSRDCMQQARSSSTPSETYAGCVNGGKITVEPMDSDASK